MYIHTSTISLLKLIYIPTFIYTFSPPPSPPFTTTTITNTHTRFLHTYRIDIISM